MAMATTPFLGCKISLISKSEIRYEGILYTIDPKESTIALSKVRSYGTEDRSAERQVPPRDEIFEYIIFRAGDIKDLIVDDPPASIAPGLADPAIIQAHSTSTSSGATFPSTTFPQMSGNTNTAISANSGQRSAAPAFTSGQNAINSLTMGAFKSTASNDSRSQNSTPTGAQQHRHSPHSETLAAQTNASKPTQSKENHKKNDRVMDRDRGGAPQPHQYRRGGGGGPGGQQGYHQNYSYGHNRRGSGGQQQNNYRQNNNHSQPMQMQTNNRFGGYNRQFNARDGGIGQRRPPLQSRPQSQRGSQNRIPNQNRVPKEPLKFDKEFDFEKGFEEFSEMEKQLTRLKLDGNSSDVQPREEDKPETNANANNDGSTNGEKDGVDSDHFYDKTKSFFDTISCEALEREKGNVQRIDWKAERKLNSETFGVPLSYRRIGYGRGRGGYGYRGYSGGGYRNRGGGGFNRGAGGDTRRFKGPQLQPQHNRN